MITADEKYFSIERYATYIPLLAPLLAVTFVGVFYAFEINFFTLFSLSEHVLFALQALPIAIVFLLFVSIFLPFIATEPKETQPTPPPLWVRKHPWLAKISVLTIIGLFLIGAVVFIGYQMMMMDLISRLFLAFMFVFVFIPVVVTVLMPTRFRQIQIVITTTLVCLFMSLLFGIAWGVGLRQSGSSSTVKLKTSEFVVGVVVRSGERGVLLYDRASDRLRFEPWDGIKSIEGPATALRLQEFESRPPP